MRQENERKRQLPLWMRLAMVVIMLLAIAIGAAIWLWSSRGSWSLILTTFFSLLGILFGFFQLFPVIFSEHLHQTHTSVPHETQPTSVVIHIPYPLISSPEPQPSLNVNANTASSEQMTGNTLILDEVTTQQLTSAAPDEKGNDEETQPVQPNPIFYFNMGLPEICEFYGRANELETIINRISYKGSTSIVGSRRIGKTWLMTCVKLIVQSKLGSHFRLGFVDVTRAECATVAGFTVKAAEELGVSLTPDRANLGLIALGEVVEELRAKRQVPILCIDEFEGFSARQRFDLDFFTGLRALTQAGLGLVVGSRSPLIDIVGDYGKTSGLFNVFEQLTLEPFTREEAEEFARSKSAQARFTDEEQGWLLQYGQLDEGQWPPIRLQLVGKMLLEEKISYERGGNFSRDEKYWQRFEKRLDEKYRAVVH